MDDRDDETTYRIPVRVVGDGDKAAPREAHAPAGDPGSAAPEADGKPAVDPAPRHPAEGFAPPVVRAAGPADDRAEDTTEDGAEPGVYTLDLDEGKPTPSPEKAAEPTVSRGRYLELARENLRLTDQMRKLQSELYQERAQKQGSEDRASERQEALARLQAEFQNYRRRVDKEREESARYAHGDLLRALLPVVDNLDRAMKSVADRGEVGADFHKGIELIRKQLHDVLAGHDLTPLEAVGQPFDPNFHEAVMRSAHPSAPADEVITEHQRGYRYKDRLLRPALVEVSSGPPEGDGEGVAGDRNAGSDHGREGDAE